MAIVFSVTYYKNDGSGTTAYYDASSKHYLDEITSVGSYWGGAPQNWSRTGYVFLYWNTAADGSGTSIEPGNIFSGTSATVYAIWQAEAGDAVIISLGETEIASMNVTGSKTLATQGTYVADDITIEYTKPAAPTPTLQNKTVSPTTSSRSVMADSGYDGLGTVTVNAISPTKSAQTYTPTTSDQTIASGRWLTGTQTIKGDANLIAGNIKKDVSIFGVTGTYEGSGGSSELYVQVSLTGYVQSSVSAGMLGLIPHLIYKGESLVNGASITVYTYGDYILDTVTGINSGTTYSFTTVSRGTYTFTMPNESVYCELYYDD